MPSLTVENYLKAIFQICHADPHRSAGTGEIAQSLQVSPGTVTSMLKTLGESGLATYMPYEGVKLTPAGRTLAVRVVRRHRLIELFLVRTLGLAWDEVHAEAENMEHAVSDFLVDRIDDFLGNPKVDPHGDPIPAADGSLEESGGSTLAECRPGEPFVVARVLNQSPEFLRSLSELGISLGARGVVEHVSGGEGTLAVRIGPESSTLLRSAAADILVTRGASG